VKGGEQDQGHVKESTRSVLKGYQPDVQPSHGEGEGDLDWTAEREGGGVGGKTLTGGIRWPGRPIERGGGDDPSVGSDKFR